MDGHEQGILRRIEEMEQHNTLGSSRMRYVGGIIILNLLWFLLSTLILTVFLFLNWAINSGIPFIIVLIISAVASPLCNIYFLHMGLLSGFKPKIVLFLAILLMNSVNMLLLYCFGMYNSDIGFIFGKIALISYSIVIIGSTILYFVKYK